MALPFPLNQNSKADLGAPSDIGAAARPPAAPGADSDAPPAPGRVTPEAVHYHEDEQRCDTCDYFGRGNQCSVLNMPVSPEGGCNAFRGGSAAPNAQDGPDMEDDADPDDDGLV